VAQALFVTDIAGTAWTLLVTFTLLTPLRVDSGRFVAPDRQTTKAGSTNIRQLRKEGVQFANAGVQVK
jgi:hypothetical protein